MRGMRCLPWLANSPHPAVPATFSRREKERRPRRVCNATVKRASSCNPERRGKKLPRRSFSQAVEPIALLEFDIRHLRSDFVCEGNRSWFAGDSERCGRW
jgi:hypothetical protein